MKKFFIYPNIDKDCNLSTTKEIFLWMLDQKIPVCLPRAVAAILEYPEYGLNQEDLFEYADCGIVLGGDGTILRAARKIAPYEKPLLGINLGRLGYLAEVEKEYAIHAIEQVMDGQYTIENRMMIQSTIETNQKKGKNHLALNDVVVTRGSFSRMLDLHIYINDGYVDVFRADGVIISTPTGSTGYNLSAGGPIIDPKTEMMVITTICPHSLYARSIVAAPQDKISVHIGETNSKYKDDLMLTTDGQEGQSLHKGDIIHIQKGHWDTKLIKVTKKKFYDILREKIVNNRK